VATLWIGSRRVELDSVGKPAAGAKAYFSDAGTLSPRTIYQDNDLSIPHANPVLADASGRFPAVFMPAGKARVRVVTSGDVPLYDDDGIDGTAPVTSEVGAGSTSSLLLLETGDMMFRLQSGTRAGYVRANARTIGNAASGATERANADTAALFEYLWNNLDNTLAPVSGGRGGTAAGDYAANKTIGLPDMRGRGFHGVDDMGNADANRLTNGLFAYGSRGQPGAVGGAATHTLDANQMPSHGHGASASAWTDTAGDHAHTGYRLQDNGQHVASWGDNFGTQAPGDHEAYATGNAGAHGHAVGVSVSIGAAGGGGAHNNLPPFMVGTCYVKL
jgi:microcystin-dependent protein